MSKSKYYLDDILDDIIKESFKETIIYLNKNDIKVEEPELVILESPESLIQKYGKNGVDKIIKKNVGAIYDRKTGKIYIIKSSIKNFVYRVSNNQNESSIGDIFTILHHEILWPLYKNDDNTEEIIVKKTAEKIANHEMGHHMVGRSEWNASVVEYLIYIYKNKLHEYPKVYKIMEENVKICEKIIREKNPSLYSLGYCFANDLIYIYENILSKDEYSQKLSIKDMIEKLRYLSEEDGIKITKRLNKVLRNYIAKAKTSKTPNEEYTMLSWTMNHTL